MPVLIEGDNCAQAWLSCAEYLLNKGEQFNLVTTVRDPCSIVDSWYREYCPTSLDASVHSIAEVETTIFPRKILESSADRDDFYKRFEKRHERAKKIHSRTRHTWGTYFERLIAFGKGRTNQLETTVSAMSRWKNNHKAAIVMHLSSPELDSVRKTRGQPCMQYIELVCPSREQLDLVAIYRNQDFFERALGNFIGLGQLLRFVATETGRHPGEVVCHSVHAYISRNKSGVRRMVRGNV